MKFVFTNIHITKDKYGIKISNKQLEVLDYKILEKSFGSIVFGLTKELLKNDYDIIVDSFGYRGSLISFIIAKLKRKQIIFWSEEWGWNRNRTIKEKIFSLLTNFLITHSDAFLVPGTMHRNYFVSLGAKPDSVFIMPNASNIFVKEEDYKNKDKLREELSIGNKKTILYIGRLKRRKGIKYLIEAFSKLKKEMDDIVLIIIGRGECREELEFFSKNLNIEDNVYFMGFIEDELLPAYYLLCDVCVMPSITFGMGDPWVFVLNEAMHFGKPVIATDAVGAAFDMIKEGRNGFMVPERNVDALYCAMKKILSDPCLEKKMGEESKRIIEEGFRYEHMVEGFRNALSKYLLL
jgi:glycosyltransferase involved in cell wall biosynthesis